MIRLIAKILSGIPHRIAKKLYEVEEEKKAKIDGVIIGAMLGMELKDIEPLSVDENSVIRVEYTITFKQSLSGDFLSMEKELKVLLRSSEEE